MDLLPCTLLGTEEMSLTSSLHPDFSPQEEGEMAGVGGNRGASILGKESEMLKAVRRWQRGPM